jgi:predicted deacylase
MVERGLDNLLAHAGVIAPREPQAAPAGPPPRLMEIAGRDYYALAPDEGLFEPFVELGDEVTAGQPCGQVHFVDNPARPPEPVAFRRAGTVICKRHPGRVIRGDCVAHLATDCVR